MLRGNILIIKCLARSEGEEDWVSSEIRVCVEGASLWAAGLRMVFCVIDF